MTIQSGLNLSGFTRYLCAVMGNASGDEIDEEGIRDYLVKEQKKT